MISILRIRIRILVGNFLFFFFFEIFDLFKICYFDLLSLMLASMLFWSSIFDLRFSDPVTKLWNYSSNISEQIYLFSGSYYMFRRRSNAMKMTRYHSLTSIESLIFYIFISFFFCFLCCTAIIHCCNSFSSLYHRARARDLVDK